MTLKFVHFSDVHWSGGAFGYFPSYSLGAMIAAQLHATIVNEFPNFQDIVMNGAFTELREWLREKVHKVGSLHASPDDLLVAVTGKPLDVGIYASYLENKYGDIYDLKK